MQVKFRIKTTLAYENREQNYFRASIHMKPGLCCPLICFGSLNCLFSFHYPCLLDAHFKFIH